MKTSVTTFRLVSILILSMLLLLQSCRGKKDIPPNIIFILADDLGYGDLGCYGQEKFRTPNIDRLAAEGVLFTRHYSGSTVCAPSRSALMTGQHTGHTPIRGNGRAKPEGQIPLPAEAITVTRLLKEAGYVTGAFGKWGLGFISNDGAPENHGVDRFYGYYCQSLAHRYYPDYLWDNETKIDLVNDGTIREEYAPDLIQEEALKFIEDHKDQKFFLYLPYTIPHAELIIPDDDILESYQRKFLPEKTYRGQDYGPGFNPRGYCSQDEAHAVFAAMVTRLDQYVEEIMAKLQELKIDNNTLIMFSSDNGPHLEGGADPDYFDSNGPLRGYKRDLYEGGIRVPFLVRWPGKIKEGTQSDHISAFWDFLPTVCELTGIAMPEGTDGISFLPALLGKQQEEHPYLYWEFHEQGGKQAVRMKEWKGVRVNVHEQPAGPIELYNLSEDYGEQNNVADEHPAIVQKIRATMDEAHLPSKIFPFEYERADDN